MYVATAVAFLFCATPALPQTQESPGVVRGTIVDDTGAAIAEALVMLSPEGSSPGIEVTSGEDGRFSLSNVPPGPFRLTVSRAGFADQIVSGVVVAGEGSTLPPIRLTVAIGGVAVDVTPTRVELAEQQIKEQEQQRVFGIIPNFMVSYDPNAVPLTAKQKFELSWKTRLDPVQFGVVAIVAGVQQHRNDFPAFGDGWEGYAKRYAAAYATVMTRSLITQVLLPSVLRQDPRYFYKGTGSTASRLGYAVSTTVIRKGDNGHWQPNYSGILGSLASAWLSNFYYPEEDRKGASLMLENTAIGLAGAAAGRLAQEFLFKKVTPHARPARRCFTRQ